ncbi:MAG: hypothetical protein JST92_10295 [Deltaproteobacteria bacterium]|nr:hypothetical protein [Deltaproteobacteria bacterium]
MIGIPLGLLYSNAGEWLIHKHILHGLGKNRSSFWSFHWHEHHAKARKHDMHDDQYEKTLFSWDPQTKELVSLLGLAAIHLPLLPIAPFFTGTVLWSMQRYYRMHKHSHLDGQWAKDDMRWHYDHHMGKDQNSNWCVTHPFFDHVMGTRKAYAYGVGAPKDIPAPENETPIVAMLNMLRQALGDRAKLVPVAGTHEVVEAKRAA